MTLAVQQTFGPEHSAYVGLENFRFLLSDPRFWKALKNTAFFASGSIFIQLPLALSLAMLLNRPNLKGRALFRLIFFAPSLIGMVFVAMIFRLIFEKRTGLMNVALHSIFPAFDLEFAWLDTYLMPALILASLWMHAGFYMVFFLAALQNVSKDQIEAASIDGAGPWQRFRHVILPAIAPVASFICLLSIIGSFQLFELPYVLLDNTGGPQDRGLTIVMYLYETGFEIGDLGYASAIGWILALILIGLATIQRTLSRKTEQ
jgi:ABC-type sugar transport system permease subunit